MWDSKPWMISDKRPFSISLYKGLTPEQLTRSPFIDDGAIREKYEVVCVESGEVEAVYSENN